MLVCDVLSYTSPLTDDIYPLSPQPLLALDTLSETLIIRHPFSKFLFPNLPILLLSTSLPFYLNSPSSLTLLPIAIPFGNLASPPSTFFIMHCHILLLFGARIRMRLSIFLLRDTLPYMICSVLIYLILSVIIVFVFISP